MGEWSAIAVRLAVYVTLGLAFGVPLQLLASAGDGRRPPRAGLALPVVAGLGASAVSLLAITAAMAAAPLLPVDREMLRIIMTETPLGTAFVVRFGALACAVLATCWPGLSDRVRLIAVAACGAVALATLAWVGHGAMDEGWRGDLHLGADIVHLLAAGAWIGAIATLLLSLATTRGPAAAVAVRTALERFARTGTIIVALLLGTGLVSGAMILGVAGVPRMTATLYGRILLVKLALFAAMLGLAALNRWALTPRLGRAADGAGALRVSLAVELAAGLAILAAVSWLGTLSPEG